MANDTQIQLALRAIDGLAVSSLTEDEKEYAAKAIKQGYLYREGDTLYTKILVSTMEDAERIFDISNRLTKGYFDTPFHEKLPVWSKISAPDVEDRGIWTWGHTIYDYRSFMDNMLRLKMNEIVVWNDYAPINAREIADYAHSLGMKLIWGFAWGWGVDCNTSAQLDEASLK